MDHRQYYLLYAFLITTTISLHGQNVSSTLKSSIKEDMKQDWLKQVKPGSKKLSSPLYDMNANSKKAIQGKDYLGLDKIYKDGGIDLTAFDDKYQINPLAITYNSSVPINQLPAGYVVPMFVGGKFIWGNPNTRVDQLVYPSGISLAGGDKKKMSAKAKNILKYVFGMEVEED